MIEIFVCLMILFICWIFKAFFAGLAWIGRGIAGCFKPKYNGDQLPGAGDYVFVPESAEDEAEAEEAEELPAALPAPVVDHADQLAILREQRKALNSQLYLIEQAIDKEADADKMIRLLNKQTCVYNQLAINARKVDRLLAAKI